jgi:hypothetical protein
MLKVANQRKGYREFQKEGGEAKGLFANSSDGNSGTIHGEGGSLWSE